ncbi:hypothetical protein [Candidatus Similichlamydia laticola]|nr:hypothetical protein [Candidatus Similichlamydia laticola]
MSLISVLNLDEFVLAQAYLSIVPKNTARDVPIHFGFMPHKERTLLGKKCSRIINPGALPLFLDIMAGDWAKKEKGCEIRILETEWY